MTDNMNSTEKNIINGFHQCKKRILFTKEGMLSEKNMIRGIVALHCELNQTKQIVHVVIDLHFKPLYLHSPYRLFDSR